MDASPRPCAMREPLRSSEPMSREPPGFAPAPELAAVVESGIEGADGPPAPSLGFA